jgi:phage tail protein X
MAKTYRTVQGDMWDSIAKKALGSESYMSTLIEANYDQRETVIFPAGVMLNLPSIASPTPTKLPPWKRGTAG